MAPRPGPRHRSARPDPGLFTEFWRENLNFPAARSCYYHHKQTRAGWGGGLLGAGAGAGQGAGAVRDNLVTKHARAAAATPQSPHRGSQVVGKTITLILMSAASGGYGVCPVSSHPGPR